MRIKLKITFTESHNHENIFLKRIFRTETIYGENMIYLFFAFFLVVSKFYYIILVNKMNEQIFLIYLS